MSKDTIVVTVKSLGGIPEISFDPDVFVKSKNLNKIDLVLDDPGNMGYRFTGFSWLSPDIPDDYSEAIKIQANKMSLKLSHEFKDWTDFIYEVFVMEGGKTTMTSAGLAAAEAAASSPGAVKQAEDSVSEAAMVARTPSDTRLLLARVQQYAIQLRNVSGSVHDISEGMEALVAGATRGPIIRNEPN